MGLNSHQLFPYCSLQSELLGFIARDDERFTEIEDQLPSLPDDIMVKHALYVWRSVWDRYNVNQSHPGNQLLLGFNHDSCLYFLIQE